MFTLTATPVMFVALLVMFTFCTLWEAWRCVRTSGPARVGHVLHLLMAIVMLLMVPHTVWQPFHSVVPLPVTIVVMALGVFWFAWRATQVPATRRFHSVSCAVMFAAMVWHLVGMQVKMSGMSGSMAHSSMGGMDHGSMGHAMPSMGSMPSMGAHPMPSMSPMPMDHGSMTMSTTSGHGALWWVALAGLPLMAWLLYAAIRALTEAFARPTGRLAALSDFAMNLGMFWMSVGLLTPVLPFMGLLRF